MQDLFIAFVQAAVLVALLVVAVGFVVPLLLA